MFALGIRYLNGWAMAAADGAKKERAEWPPHPDRVFMALAAAWFETNEAPEQGAALRWLETLAPPQISASDASVRSATNEDRPTVSYVPVNDIQRGRRIPETNGLVALKDAGLALLPEHRPRYPRHFPVAVPCDPVVFFVWANAELATQREGLERLLCKVTHVGHPASFVQMWIEEAPPVPNWAPVEGQATHRLRVFGPGRLDYLRARCNRNNVVAHADLLARISEMKGRAKETLQAEMQERFGSATPVSLRPEPGRWQGYDRPPSAPPTEIPGSIFDPRLTLLTLSGKRLSLPSTLKLLETLRGAIFAACPDPIPEWVSGHRADGKPSSVPHMAMLPLPFVGYEHADGRLMGVALALPKGLDRLQAARCLGPLLHDEYGLSRRNKLFAGQWLECSVELESRESPPASLRAELWTRPSRAWASVTPVVLDRHFDGKDKWERAADIVGDACERIGLPRPKEVLLHPVSLIEGVPHAREFPCLIRKSDGGRIQHSHAIIVFETEVVGPVLVGAGRFRGYGLFRPMDEGADHE
jgi:CRISPR-associated protein Csb2